VLEASSPLSMGDARALDGGAHGRTDGAVAGGAFDALAVSLLCGRVVRQ
jgi:hypothetical protein